MAVQIITLVENTVFTSNLQAEHGLSFYIETEDIKILFDCGQTDLFMQNAEKLGVNLNSVDFLVLSHGHYDHTGGLGYFLNVNNKAAIFLKKEALWHKFHGERYNGMDKKIMFPVKRTIFINEITEIAKNVLVVPNINIYFQQDTHFNNLTTLKENQIIEDQFEDELFLCIKHNGKISIINSCSHRGITNITQTAVDFFNLPVHTITGGFHLQSSHEQMTYFIADYFNKNQPENIGVCHCTGINNYNILKNRCYNNVFYNSTGNKTII